MDVDELVRAVRTALDDTERFAHSARQDFFTLEVLGIFAAYGDARHVLHHDPVAVLRLTAAARRVLERHQPYITKGGQATCEHCPADYEDELTPWPCPEIRDLADGLGIDLDRGHR